MKGYPEREDRTFTAREVALLDALKDLGDAVWNVIGEIMTIKGVIDDTDLMKNDPTVDRLRDVTSLEDSMYRLHEYYRNEYLKLRYGADENEL